MSGLVIFESGDLSVADQRELVIKMQGELLDMEQAKIVTSHRFLPGIYERTITIPPWTVLTGSLGILR
jgi:hypothetical protein